MKRWLLALAVATAFFGCSTRSVVVQPDEVSKLNDSRWTIKSAPAVRTR